MITLFRKENWTNYIKLTFIILRPHNDGFWKVLGSRLGVGGIGLLEVAEKKLIIFTKAVIMWGLFLVGEEEGIEELGVVDIELVEGEVDGVVTDFHLFGFGRVVII